LPPQQAIKTASAQLQPEKIEDKSFTKIFAKITQFVNEVIYRILTLTDFSHWSWGKSWKQRLLMSVSDSKHEFQTLLVRTYSRAFVELMTVVRFLAHRNGR